MSSQVKRLIKLVVSANIFLFDCCVRCVLSMIKKEPATCIVTYYHGVYSEDRKRFAEQMDDLLHLTNPIPLRQFEPFESGVRYSAVTFDDGLTCIIENAVPELIQRKIPFTIFVPTGYVGKQSSWVQHANGKIQREAIITEEQLRELANNELIIIGSHCVTHSNLLLLDTESAKIEITKSKKDLESILDSKVTLLSFPYGGHNTAHIELAREAGYKMAFTILPALVNSGSNNFVIGRVRVDPLDWRIEYRLKLLGAYRWLPKAFFIKQKFSSWFRSTS